MEQTGLWLNACQTLNEANLGHKINIDRLHLAYYKNMLSKYKTMQIFDEGFSLPGIEKKAKLLN